jgi:WD40 repeat protein
VLFAPTGEWLATSSCDRTVKLWDRDTFRATATFGPHDKAVFALAISPDGKLLAAGLGRGNNRLVEKCDVVVWDVATGKRTLVLSGHEHDVRSAAFAPDGTLATASFDGTIRRWDVSSGECLNTVDYSGPLHCVRYSDDGSILVSANGDSTAIVWDQATWKPKTILRSNTHVHCVAVSPDNSTVATGNNKGFVELWDAASGGPKRALLTCVDLFAADTRIMSLDFSGDNHQLASASGSSVAGVWEWRTEPGVMSTINLGNSWTDFVFDDSLMHLIGTDTGWDVVQWSLETGNASNLRPPDAYSAGKKWRHFLAAPPSGQMVATPGPDGQLEIIEAPTGRRVAMLADKRGGFVYAGFLQNDRTLLGIVDCTDERGPAWTASVWDTSSAHLLHQFPRYESVVDGLSIHPSKRVFAITAGPVIRTYELPSGRLITQLDGHSGGIYQLTFSPDGRRLASAGSDGTATIWDWANGTELRRLIGDYSAIVRCIAFSPDGQTLSTGQLYGTVRLWNTESGQEMIRLGAGFVDVRRLQFSADGKRLACWSKENSEGGRHDIRVWSIER